MFELNADEWTILRSQFASSSWGGKPICSFRIFRAGYSYAFKCFKKRKSHKCEYKHHADLCRYSEMIQASPSSLSRELEEIKERIKALEEISEENEGKFDDIYIALTGLTMKQKLAAKPHNPIGFIKLKE